MPSKLRKHATRVGLALAKRADDDAVAKISQEDPHSASSQYCLSHGHAGLALMWEQADRCFPGKEFELIAQQHLKVARDSLKSLQRQPLGLFAGLSGYAFATRYLSRGGSRYRNAQAEIDAALHPAVLRCCERLKSQEHLTCADFDLISGLTGVGAYLLTRRDDPNAQVVLQSVTAFLVALLGDPCTPPRWHTPHFLIAGDSMRREFPQGNLNCGLAHGVPGPLALLSLAYENGLRMPGLENAIERAADWLMQNRGSDEWGPNWPSARGLSEPRRSQVSRMARAAWCYGSPGIARALWLAGRALRRQEFQDLALEAMAAVFRRPFATLKLDSTMFCHGQADVLQVTWRFAGETRQKEFLEAAASLTESILARHDETSVTKPSSASSVTTRWVLEGLAGIALTLFAVGESAEPDWDRAFLLN